MTRSPGEDHRWPWWPYCLQDPGVHFHGEVMSPHFVDMKRLFSTDCLCVGLRVSTKLSSDLLFSTWLKRFKFGQGICFNTNSMWSKLINGCTPQEMVLKIGWKYLQKGRAPYQILYTLVTNQEVLQQHSVAPPFFDVFYLSGVFLSLATSQKQSFPLQKGVLPQHLKLVKTSRIYYRMGIICLRSEVLP